MPTPQLLIADRRRGLLAGCFGNPEPRGGGPPELILARELTVALPSLDLGALVRAWTNQRSVPGLPGEIRASLDWIASQGTPPPDLGMPPGLGAALVTLPLVLRTYLSNQNVLTGAYHLAALLDPHPVGQWAAVAVSVAAACFLRGRSDFVADLIEALRENEAPSELVAMARRLPNTVLEAQPRWRLGSEVVDGLEPTLAAVIRRRPTGFGAASRLARPVLARIEAALIGARDGTPGTELPDELEMILSGMESE